ncbi:MAG: MBL fold metallo-hydrolase [Candidatus Promineifilaceae bacterium]
MNFLGDRLSVVVLGIAQDAGIPHAGCCCPRCQAAFTDRNLSQFAASIAIVDARQYPIRTWLVDASPDLKFQLELLRDALGPHPTKPDRLRQPDGVFLTHAHMGHTAGLVHFGPEAMAVDDLKLFASAGLVAFLRENFLWAPLADRLELVTIEPSEPIYLAPGLIVEPIPVPHRDEVGAGTFAYQISGETRKLLYLPDIDSWDQWTVVDEVLGQVDIALVDATFFNKQEMPDAEPALHPPAIETVMRFRDLPTRIILSHLNHTNPLLDADSEERHLVEANGMEIAWTGQVFEL